VPPDTLAADRSLPRPAPEPPAWYPGWGRELAELYFSGSTSFFLLHGNVRDLVGSPTADGVAYGSLPDFLAAQVFGSWDLVLHYDLGRGLRVLTGGDSGRLGAMMQYLTARLGEPASWPRDPETVLLTLDRLLERNLLEEAAPGPKSVALVLDYAQYLVPAGDLGSLGRGAATNLVRLLGWAQNPYFKRINVSFCLLADKLTEVNDRLVQSSHVAALEVPLPDLAERRRFCELPAAPGAAEPPAEELAALANGLTLLNLQVLLGQGRAPGRRVDRARFRQLKKTLIERQCQGLLEFLEPRHTLDLVVGHEAVKDRLRQDADLIARGQLGAAPMGYLVCGPVGTGKSFLAECYAGSIGIPCVKLRNFRSKYVGETEGNLERLLTVLRSLGPVVVVIDEADAALGTRQAEGDSGTSSRVFAMLAAQMGDTDYRGQVVWMLLTSRPELLPIDLKRQGRAEVHVPLFYPQDDAEVRAMFLAMARKNRVTLTPEAVPPVKAERRLSGSDIESIVLAAQRQALTTGRPQPGPEDLKAAADEFLPSAQGLEKELQELAAVLECTQLSLLPPEWRRKLGEPEGRQRLQERLVALRQLLGA
jgi:AAA+ superfamily predicted ATPase